MCHPDAPAGAVAPPTQSENVLIPTAEGDMPAVLTTSPVHDARPVLIVADIFGPSPFYASLAARLAAAGFIALLPDYFFRLGALSDRTFEAAGARRSRLDEGRTQDDLVSAIDWLATRTGARRVGTVGFCMGGTQVLTLTTRGRDLASVCFYGLPAARPHGGPGTLPAPLEVVDRMAGPILGFWGDQDEGVGVDNVARLASALREHDVQFEHTIYPGLGHGFMAASELNPEHPAYAASADAWARTLDFYRTHLRA